MKRRDEEAATRAKAEADEEAARVAAENGTDEQKGIADKIRDGLGGKTWAGT